MKSSLRSLLLTTAAGGFALALAGPVSAQSYEAVGTAPADQPTGPVDPRDARIADLEMRLNALSAMVEKQQADNAAALAKVEKTAASMPKVSWKGAPEFGGPDGSKFKVRGRALVDGVFQTWSPEAAGDLDVREFRARQMFLGVEGRINERFAYKIEGGWANGSNPSWDDAYLEFNPTKTSAILIGNAKAVGLENLTSTRFVTFMERGPYANVAALDYNVGVIAKTWGKNWSLTAAVQGDTLNAGDTVGEETLSEVIRATYSPILTDETKTHIGVWARHRDNGDGALFSYTPRPSTAYIPGGVYSLKGTGGVGEKDNTLGLEGLVIHRNLSLQGEYVHVAYDGTTAASDGDINAGYLMGSIFFGGSRSYSASGGEVGRPKVDHDLMSGGSGALELALRYDFANINDSITAGDYRGYSLGANYYPSPYMRLMLNYTDGAQDNPLLNDDVDVRVLQMRAQIDF